MHFYLFCGIYFLRYPRADRRDVRNPAELCPTAGREVQPTATATATDTRHQADCLQLLRGDVYRDPGP